MFLEEKKNFLVDPVKGKIILLLGKSEVEIKLKFMGEEEKKEEMMESSISEEFGGKISEF